MTMTNTAARRKRLASIAPLAALLAAMLPMDTNCGGPRLQGQTYVAASCTSWAGFTWNAWTSGFKPSTRIKYKATVWYNGVVWWHTESGPGYYTTDSRGNHYQWPAGGIRNSLQCGSGNYMVEVWTQDETNSTNTFSGSDGVWCG